VTGVTAGCSYTHLAVAASRNGSGSEAGSGTLLSDQAKNEQGVKNGGDAMRITSLTVVAFFAIASVVPAVAEKGRSLSVCRPRVIGIVTPQQGTLVKKFKVVIGQCNPHSTIVAKSPPQTCHGGSVTCHGSCSGTTYWTANWTCCDDPTADPPRATCRLDCQHEEMDCVYQ